MQTTNFPMPLFYVEVEHELDLQSHTAEQSKFLLWWLCYTVFNTDSGHGDILWWVCYGIVLVCVVCGEILWSQVVNLQSATCMCKNCNSCNFWSDRKLWCAICTIAPKLHLHHYLQLLKKSGKYNNELLLLCQNMRISQYKLNAQKYWFQNRLHAAQCSCSIKIAQKQSFELNFWSSKTQHFPMQLTWKRYKKRAVQIVELIVYTEKPESLAEPDPMCAKQSGKRLSRVRTTTLKFCYGADNHQFPDEKTPICTCLATLQFMGCNMW